MHIILLEDIEKVGEKHELVEVKNGYARNFLIPQGKAIVANKGNRAKLDELKAKEAATLEAELAKYREAVAKLDGVVLQIGAKAGTSGKIFGSVTGLQIANAIQEKTGMEVDRRNVELPEEVKELGTYTAEVAFHKQVTTRVNFEVVEDK